MYVAPESFGPSAPLPCRAKMCQRFAQGWVGSPQDPETLVPPPSPAPFFVALFSPKRHWRPGSAYLGCCRHFGKFFESSFFRTSMVAVQSNACRGDISSSLLRPARQPCHSEGNYGLSPSVDRGFLAACLSDHFAYSTARQESVSERHCSCIIPTLPNWRSKA